MLAALLQETPRLHAEVLCREGGEAAAWACLHQWVHRLQQFTPMGALLAAAADGAAGAAVSSSSAARLASGSRLYASPEYRDKGAAGSAMPASSSGAFELQKN